MSHSSRHRFDAATQSLPFVLGSHADARIASPINRSHAAWADWTLVTMVTAAAAVHLWCSYTIINDHFGRISPARHILLFGEVPFRDFLDPGFFLTLYSSALMQWLLGYNLLGEVVLNVGCMAVGYALTFRLATRASGSHVIGLGAVIAALVVVPRAYDYDKVLFYPWGLYACWRYIDRPTPLSLVHLAVAIVLAGLFRYDTAVYLGLSAVVGILVRHWGCWRLAAGQLARLTGLVLVLAAPVLLFISDNGGLSSAIDQVVTYARREGSRTRVLQVAPLRLEATSSVAGLLADSVAAATILSYVALALPAAALLGLPLDARTTSTGGLARRVSAAVLGSVTALVIVRDPVIARIGAVMPVIVVLAASVVTDPFRTWLPGETRTSSGVRTIYRIFLAASAIVMLLALTWPAMALARRPQVAYLSAGRIAELARTPPATGLAARYEPLVAYIRACTTPTDRVLATWFAPELYFYSDRGFAGGLPVMFGGHWSEDRFERRVLGLLEKQTVPLVIMRYVPRQVDVDYVRAVWPFVSAYIDRHYEVAAITNFGLDDLTYQLWVRRGLTPTGRYGAQRLPCYGGSTGGAAQ